MAANSVNQSLSLSLSSSANFMQEPRSIRAAAAANSYSLDGGRDASTHESAADIVNLE